VTVRARVSGQIVSIAFQEGTRVKVGELLVQVDARPFKIALEQAAATLQRDLATLKNNERDLVRYKDLVAQKLIAQQQYDAQDRPGGLGQGHGGAGPGGAVNNARLNLQFSSVTSPIDGIAGVRQVDVGNLVTPTDANGIVVLTQMDPIAVLFTLPQTICPGRRGVQQGPAHRRGVGPRRAEQARRGEAHVIDNQVNTGTATIRLKAEFPNPDFRLWPSLFVKARMHLETRQNVVVVATPAIQRGPNGTFVYVVNPTTRSPFATCRSTRCRGRSR
jgi:multidrug efflux system membrane fusion protein